VLLGCQLGRGVDLGSYKPDPRRKKACKWYEVDFWSRAAMKRWRLIERRSHQSSILVDGEYVSAKGERRGAV